MVEWEKIKEKKRVFPKTLIECARFNSYYCLLGERWLVGCKENGGVYGGSKNRLLVEETTVPWTFWCRFIWSAKNNQPVSKKNLETIKSEYIEIGIGPPLKRAGGKSCFLRARVREPRRTQYSRYKHHTRERNMVMIVSGLCLGTRWTKNLGEQGWTIMVACSILWDGLQDYFVCHPHDEYCSDKAYRSRFIPRLHCIRSGTSSVARSGTSY